MMNIFKTTLQAIILILAISLLISLMACNKSAKQGGGWNQGPVAVATTKVSLAKADYYTTYPGTVVALNQIDLRPQVSGYITEIYFKDGDHVTKGQKLYAIDAQMYAANYDQAVANLKVQESQLNKAQKDADRYHDLAKEDAIAKQQVDYADAALVAAQKQVDAAKANVQSLQTAVKYTSILAPFTGTIGISQVKVGAAVTAGVTLLNTVSTNDPMGVDFAIDQKEIYRFTTLQQKRNAAHDTTFSIVFNEKDVYPQYGHIALLDRAVDPQTGTLKVRLEFANKNDLLRSGMSCNVRVASDNSVASIVIPAKAVTEQLGDYFVYVVDGDKVTQRKVTPGNHVGMDVIITNGLKEGETIVTEGVQKLHEGSAIQTSDASAKK